MANIDGFFLSKKTGTYTIIGLVYANIRAQFNFSDVYAKDGRSGFNTYTKKYLDQYLYANRCYPLMIAGNVGAGHPPQVQATIDNYDDIIDTSNSVLIDCMTDDCLPGYYTDTCSQVSDSYCNENGIPEYGRDSDGLGCYCDSFTDNMFCEDTSKYYFDEGKRGISYISKYTDSFISNRTVLSNFDDIEMSESYTTVTLESVLYVPQNTYLQFLLQSKPFSSLYIDGELVSGSSLSDQYSCDETPDETYLESPKTYFTRGNHNIKIVMLPGCAIHDQTIDLKWKFYRLHRNADPDSFDYESIPERYLGIPQ